MVVFGVRLDYFEELLHSFPGSKFRWDFTELRVLMDR